MSRYTITVTGQGRSDPEAIIGYDPPLQTFFLQAFHHEVTDDPALWLGTCGHAFERLEDLHRAALACGFDFMPLSAEVSSKLIEDKVAAGAATRLGLAEFLK
ncbi:hypothetical protein [Mesorhizobium sp.]|uniref:hypothetical protein n=1 Tax=Mesorhizobium sp. TaxID=1871066 RepID=UPI000FE54746|nr:hypothetical protein [Mesorhizobium sp.]RWH77990.1 MAG: hypothetical protein EOQ85_16770 [Mesorhizobium sp.]